MWLKPSAHIKFFPKKGRIHTARCRLNAYIVLPGPSALVHPYPQIRNLIRGKTQRDREAETGSRNGRNIPSSSRENRICGTSRFKSIIAKFRRRLGFAHRSYRTSSIFKSIYYFIAPVRHFDIHALVFGQKADGPTIGS